MKKSQKKKVRVGVSKKYLLRNFNNKSEIGFSLCLNSIVSGMHMDFVIVKERKNAHSFAVLHINGEAFGFYNLEISDHLDPKNNSLRVDMLLSKQK